MPRLSLAAVLALCVIPLPAHAQQAADDCGFVDYDSASPIRIARVKPGVGKLHFALGGTEAPGCPGEQASCRARAYLEPNDLVIASRVAGGFLCSQYISAKGRITAGWLPLSGVDLLAVRRAKGSADWVGTWLRDEASITISARRDGKLKIEGEAVANSHDPEIVRRGNVRSGDIQAVTRPVDGHLEFGAGDDVPFVASDTEQNCQMKLWRVESLLLVEDTGNCGGSGVTFTGIYSLKK